MLVPSDFWDVRQQERIEIERLEGEVAQIQRSVELARVGDKISKSLGFSELVQKLTDILRSAETKLSNANLSNDQLREQRGKVQAYQEILGVLTKASPVAELERALQQRQNDLESAKNRRPKPREVTS